MLKSKDIFIYLAISYGIMLPVCVIVSLLHSWGVAIYDSIPGFIAIAVGGLSTAVAGAFAAKRSGKISSYAKLLRDFFFVKQPLRYYATILVFFLLVFGYRMFSGQWQEGRGWLSLPGLFAMSVLFGGIEEIGWRYLFQPALERKISFSLASCVTFVLWGIWHIMYFVVDGSIRFMTLESLLLFLLGLLGNTFVLGCIYRITKSLWLCVFYHALLNALSQMFFEMSLLGTLMVTIVSIVLSSFFVHRENSIR